MGGGGGGGGERYRPPNRGWHGRGVGTQNPSQGFEHVLLA